MVTVKAISKLNTYAQWEGRRIPYQIVKTDRGWFTPDGVPLEVCGLGAGPDAWRRTIMVPCDECRKPCTAEVYGANGGSCEACMDDFWCKRCGGHPDDCDGTTCTPMGGE